jgi:hypothetical protein
MFMTLIIAPGLTVAGVMYLNELIWIVTSDWAVPEPDDVLGAAIDVEALPDVPLCAGWLEEQAESTDSDTPKANTLSPASRINLPVPETRQSRSRVFVGTVRISGLLNLIAGLQARSHLRRGFVADAELDSIQSIPVDRGTFAHLFRTSAP